MAEQKTCKRHSCLKPPRKPRIIKNATVNIDDVTIAAGTSNTDWITIARLKLLLRELELLRQKQKILDQTIMNALQSFSNLYSKQFRFNPFPACVGVYHNQIQHKLVSKQSQIMRQCSHAIAIILTNWKGYKPDRESGSFRDYFLHCRHWFDGKKPSIIAVYFWIPIMIIIHEIWSISFVKG
eukprot:658148_1